MAEEKQIGIPQEPLDYSSELATRPYELDADKKYEVQRHAVGNESLRRAVVGSDWKISKATAPTQFFTGLGQGVESIISEAIPKSVVKWGTDPSGATAGAVVGTTGYSVGSRVAGKAVSNIAPKLLSGAVKLVGGVTGALGLATIFDPTPIATQEEETTSLKNFILKDAETKLETAKTDLSQGKITQEEYDTAQTQYDKAVQTVKRVGEYAETYDEVVESLDGIAYPSESFADSAVSGASRLLQAREELQALRNAKKGIDPESPWYKAGNVLGNVAVYGGSAVLGNQIARYGIKGTVKRALIDEETKKGAEMLSAVKPVRSRKEAQELVENIVKGTTAEIESASYVWENARDYIEKTGDTTLSEFTPKDAKTLSAAAYGAIAGEIEVMGGVEALATGAFRDLGLISAGKAIAKTVISEGGEEATQTFTEYLSRRIDGTTDKTIGEALKDSLNSFVWAGFGGIVPGTIGHLATRHARNQGVKILQDYGLSRDTAEKVFDKMADTVADANNPQMETVRDNLRSKVSAMYEDIDMPVAEKEDVIDATTDLEMSWLMTEATENGYAPEESPLLQGVVNEIGYFRTGIPEQISEDVERLNNEIKDLRERLKEEQAKETKDYEKIDNLESKIEQFFAKLPQDIAKLVETDRQRIREMLSEQSSQLKDNQARKQLVRRVRERAIKAMQKQDESELQKSLRRLEEQAKTEEQKAREAEREQKKEQRKIRKAVEKLRTKLLSRTVAERVMDEDLFYDLLLQNGYTDVEIAKMSPRTMLNAYDKIIKRVQVATTQSSKHDYGTVDPDHTVEERRGDLLIWYMSDGNGSGKIRFLTPDKKIIGQIDFTPKGIRYLYVEPEYRGKYAELLWKEAERFSNPSTLLATNREDTPLPQAIKFWEKMGFKHVGNGKMVRETDPNKKLEKFPTKPTLSETAEKPSALEQSKDRGFYIPEYRFIGRTQNMDATTLSHELAHDWMQQYFRHYRSGKASPEFMKSWGAVEKALGISPDEINVPEKASEAFARAYEGWVMNKKDWAKNIAVDDNNREDVIKTLERYQEYITDVYNDLTNPYFRETWGEVGELKPELKAWFDQVTLAEDAVAKQVETGKITPQQATAKIIDKIVEKSEDTFTEKEKAEIETVNRINDTSRYEVEGGNKNSLQKRLSGLAQSMDSNNAVLGRYETRRDMLEVAKAADEFVRTRRDEAMDIINGIKPETEGLYASDLYTALERLAVENNDVDLAMELVNSKVATELAKELGQRVAGFRNFKGNGDFDVISQLKSLDQKFKKDYEKNGKAQVEEAADDYVKELKKADSEQDVDSFLKSIECQ